MRRAGTAAPNEPYTLLSDGAGPRHAGASQASSTLGPDSAVRPRRLSTPWLASRYLMPSIQVSRSEATLAEKLTPSADTTKSAGRLTASGRQLRAGGCWRLPGHR